MEADSVQTESHHSSALPDQSQDATKAMAVNSPTSEAREARSIVSDQQNSCHNIDPPSISSGPKRSRAGAEKDIIARPLHLLDLPLDILKDIVRELTHTNDLTSLALCHSALHRLAIPHIYSRFDIVWPESTTPIEPRAGVDALTYGLSTLVMAEDVFGESQSNESQQQAEIDNLTPSAKEARVRRRKGNYYAQFTRKFSLGNGPPEWVQEYFLNKEAGKMLGTLVALAVARMRNLETFIWDMPTGIGRSVWLALSSLDGRDDGHACRLERVAVRCHDNSSDPDHLPAFHAPPLANLVSPLQALAHVEHPSFSVLSPLSSVSVLDIDELQYLDELSVLIGRSCSRLKQLRIGIARHVERDWLTVWEYDHLQQIDKQYPTAGTVTLGEKRLGGVLGVLTGWIFDIHTVHDPPPKLKRSLQRIGVPDPGQHEATSNITSAPVSSLIMVLPIGTDSARSIQESASPQMMPPTDTVHDNEGNNGEATVVASTPATTATTNLASEEALHSVVKPVPQDPGDTTRSAMELTTPNPTRSTHVEPQGLVADLVPAEARRLSLDTLELERVPLSIVTLQHAIDWSKLTSLTLLQCKNSDLLWKTLQRVFAPTDPNGPKTDSNTRYQICLTKIHTDMVSSSLITFIKEALAPDSLRTVFFLKQCRQSSNNVTLDSIFRGVLRRHRNSLTKVLLNSSEKTVHGLPVASSGQYKKWMLSREVLHFITSGKMPALQELGVTLDFKDWHFFLQHLPSIPHLRALYLPHLANAAHSNHVKPQELALQIVDIITLRPEIQLCYLGIAAKCFEILENQVDDDEQRRRPYHLHAADDSNDEDDEEDDDDEDDSDDSDESGDTSSDRSISDTDDESAGDGTAKRVTQLRLREILYYDDKVSIFKARHGRL